MNTQPKKIQGNIYVYINIYNLINFLIFSFMTCGKDSEHFKIASYKVSFLAFFSPKTPSKLRPKDVFAKCPGWTGEANMGF